MFNLLSGLNMDSYGTTANQARFRHIQNGLNTNVKFGYKDKSDERMKRNNLNSNKFMIILKHLIQNTFKTDRIICLAFLDFWIIKTFNI